MNQFAQLRHQIYLDHAPDDPEGYRCLAAALSQSSEPLEPVLESMARLHASVQASDESDGHDADWLASMIRSQLGRSPYIDRYLADALCQRDEFAATLRQCATQVELTGAVAAVAVGAQLRPFDAAWVADQLRQHRDPDILIDVLSYASAAGLVELEAEIAALSAAEQPWGVRAEALSVLHELSEESTPEVAADPESPRPQLAQAVFYGDPSRMGKGGSGGLGTLVRELGVGLAQHAIPVLTLVGYDSKTCRYPLQVEQRLDSNHEVRRVPIYLPSHNPAGFLRAEHRIVRATERALHGEHHRVVHVRFLDNASRAVAKVASSRRWPLVTTLTPDPHRNLCTPEGHINPCSAEAAREVFNRILIGDQLLHWSRGLAAIGRNAFAHELIHYFPQLENTCGKVLAAIDEGVATTLPPVALDPAALLCNPQLDLALTPQQLATPLIVSVGRLHPIKGQVNLVRAWAHSPLWQRYNLVIIGGDLDTPSGEERAIIDAIRAEWRAELQGRLCHLPAQDNTTVRAILAWSGQRQPTGGADVYVCASLKEEFGLSILEAMVAGLPVCAPLRGGPKTYLRHGVNGFLIDTRDAQVLRKELCALLTRERTDCSALRALKHKARQTVEQQYSLTAMAAEYAEFYRRVAAQPYEVSS